MRPVAGSVGAALAVGPGANNSDRLFISGALTLGDFDQIIFNGSLDGVSSYNLAKFGSRSGTFDSFNTPSGY